MTLVSLPSPILWPGILGAISGALSLSNLVTISAAGHYGAYIFCAREDMTISHVGFRSNTATGSPTVDVRIETVDAGGLPSGTLWATNTNGITGTVSSNVHTLQALTASASITKGQVFCVKVAYVSGTSLVLATINGFSGLSQSLPYAVTNTGSPAKGTVAVSGTFVLGSSSTTFYNLPGMVPIGSITANTFNNTSSARRGLRFTLPFNCRIVGMRWHNTTSSGNYNAILFDDAGTELSSSSTAFDGDHNAANVNGGISVYFDNTVTGSAGTTYRAVLEPSSATNVNIYTYTLPSVNYRGATPAGTTAHYTTYVASSWTDTATDTLPLMDIIIDQIDDGAGSGSGVIGVIGG